MAADEPMKPTPHDPHTPGPAQSSDELGRRIAYLSRFVTDRRLKRIEAAVGGRTRRLSLVLEDVRNPFNATAVTRTCEGLGMQEMHIIENEHRFQLSDGVTQGAAKWIDMYRWNDAKRENTRACLNSLTERGFLVVATTPHRDGYTPESIPLERPVAVVFGHEKTGVSDAAIAASEATLRLPMYGFVESFNITVSVGMCMARLRSRVEEEFPDLARVCEAQQRELTLRWLKQSVPRRVIAAMEREIGGSDG